MHMESFSRSSPKKKNKNKTPKLSVAGVMAEAMRTPGNHPHVKDPSPPILIYGNPPELIEQKCEEWAAGTPDSKGNKARKDALCLLAGVFSMPREETTPEAWEKIKKDAIAWLEAKYGDRLQTVVEHTDEAHPHCHFYIIPRPGERFDAIHAGHFAEREAKENGKNRKEQNVAYRAAMRGVQNEYFDEVGAPNGLVRIGPGRRRLTRAQWQAEKAQGQAIGQKFQELEAKLNGADQKLAMADAAVSGAEVAVDRIRSEALVEIRELQKKAQKDADKALEDAKQKGVEEGRSEAIEQFGKASLWGKLTSLLTKKDKEINELKDKVKTLRKERNSAIKERDAAVALADKAPGLKTLVQQLKKLGRRLTLERDRAKEEVKVLRERDDGYHDLVAERDLERARANQLERRLAVLEAPQKAQEAATPPSRKWTHTEPSQTM